MLKSIIVYSIILLFSSVSICSAETVRMWKAYQEDQIELFCAPFTYEETECQLASLYGLKQVMRLMYTIDRDSMEWEILQELMDKHYIKKIRYI